MPPERRDLEVQAAFHEQVHEAKVAALAFSADGALWSGCDADAPKPEPSSSREPPVCLVDPSTGQTLRRAEGAPACNVRLLLRLPAAGGLLCVAGDGALLLLSDAEGAVHGATALPGTPAAEAATAALVARELAGNSVQQEEQQPCTPAVHEAVQQTEGGNSAGREFEAEAGYRGHREGYLFRDGVLGRGYYRKDTVRRHCAWAAPVLPAAGAAAGTLPTADGAADGDTGSQGPQQQQQQQAGGGEAARQYIQRLLQAPPNMHSVVADPSRGLLFTASLGPSDCSIRAWRLHQGSSGSRELRAELHRTLTGHTASVLSLALSADGSLLFSGSHDYTVRVWSTADWCCLRTLKGHGGGVRALVAAPDGATLYSAASDNTIRAWSTQHWVCLRTMHGRHEDTTWPTCLALSPDGGLLASGSTGPFGASTIKLFQAGGGGGREAGACLASFAQLGYHTRGAVTALLFSPDGATLYSGASDGTLAGWRLAWREPAGAGAGGSLRRGFL